MAQLVNPKGTIFLLLFITFATLTLFSTADFTYSVSPWIDGVPEDHRLSSGTGHIAGLKYNLGFTFSLLPTTTLSNPTVEKTITFQFDSTIFNINALPIPTAPKTPETPSDDETTPTDPQPIDECHYTLCSGNNNLLCVNISLTTEYQTTLNNAITPITVTCLGALTAFRTTSTSPAINAVITAANDPTTVIDTSTLQLSTTDLFPTLLFPTPTLTQEPQLIQPNTDFIYKITFTLPTIPNPMPSSPLHFTFFTHYSTPFNITTCRAKDESGDYLPLGVPNTVDINTIDLRIDPAFIIPIVDANPDSTNLQQALIDLYCTMHAPISDSTTPGGTWVFYIPSDDTTPNPTILAAAQVLLSDIIVIGSGLRVDYRMNQLTRWFLTMEQINKIITTTERSLANGGRNTLPTTATSSTSTNKLSFTCRVLDIQREFHLDYPYPGASAGYWTIEQLSLFCHIATSNGQTTQTGDSSTLAYVQQTYQDAITRLWLVHDIVESSVLWQISHFQENIIFPHPTEEEGGEEEAETPAEEEAKGEDDEPVVTEGPVFYPNGTIYDNTIYELEWTTLKLFKLGSFSVPAHCFNGVQDYGEIDVDCGGECPLCNAGKVCIMEGEDAGKNTNNSGGCIFTCVEGLCSENGTDNSTHLSLLAILVTLIVTFLF